MARWRRSGLEKSHTQGSNSVPAGVLVEPTADERKNGWTAESLTKYLNERKEANSRAILDKPRIPPAKANGTYQPQRWRG